MSKSSQTNLISKWLMRIGLSVILLITIISIYMSVFYPESEVPTFILVGLIISNVMCILSASISFYNFILRLNK